MAHTVNPLTRRAFLHGGVRLSLVVAGLVGVPRVPDVAADKKKKRKLICRGAHRDAAR